MRVVHISAELRAILADAFEQAEAGETLVVPMAIPEQMRAAGLARVIVDVEQSQNRFSIGADAGRHGC